jgi:AraC-like DNA-binding protein
MPADAMPADARCEMAAEATATAAGLQPVVFSTDGVDPCRRFDMWRSHYESFNAITLPEDSSEDFYARNEVWPFGPLALMRNLAPAMMVARTARHARRDSLDHWVIRVARSGSSRYRIGGTCFDTRPGLPFLFSAGDPCDSERTGADWLSLYLSRDAFPDIAAGLAAIGTGVLAAPGSVLLADYLLLLERRLQATTVAEVPMLVAATRAMVAACLLTDVAPRSVSPEDVDVARLERIRQVVRRNIGSATLDSERLSKLAGVSRSQLYRIFEPHGGVARYVQNLRLRLAHAALTDPDCDTPIAQIGEQVGFFDPSSFSRAFRREFGYTPGEVRAAGPGGLPSAAAEGDQPVSPGLDYGNLLRRIGASERVHQLA